MSAEIASKLYIPQMKTIQEVANLTGISSYHIRKLCKNNQIAFIKTGTKYLINLEKFINYLNRENGI